MLGAGKILKAYIKLAQSETLNLDNLLHIRQTVMSVVKPLEIRAP